MPHCAQCGKRFEYAQRHMAPRARLVQVRGEQQLLQELSQARKALAMVYADWCGACQYIKPTVESDEVRELVDVVLLINEAEPTNRPILKELAVEGFPTFVYKPGHGQKHIQWSGANPEELRSNLQRASPIST